MAKIIKTNGEIVEIKEELTLETMQKAVGGYIEIVRSEDAETSFVCDEEGKLKGYAYNEAATALGISSGAIYDDCFVGDVIVARSSEIK